MIVLQGVAFVEDRGHARWIEVPLDSFSSAFVELDLLLEQHSSVRFFDILSVKDWPNRPPSEYNDLGHLRLFRWRPSTGWWNRFNPEAFW